MENPLGEPMAKTTHGSSEAEEREVVTGAAYGTVLYLCDVEFGTPKVRVGRARVAPIHHASLVRRLAAPRHLRVVLDLQEKEGQRCATRVTLT
jgi:hypothetical protein